MIRANLIHPLRFYTSEENNHIRRNNIVTTHNNTIFEQKIFLDDCCVAENDVTQLKLNCRKTNLTFFIWNTIDGFAILNVRTND